jgi:hypothetical protein
VLRSGLLSLDSLAGGEHEDEDSMRAEALGPASDTALKVAVSNGAVARSPQAAHCTGPQPPAWASEALLGGGACTWRAWGVGHAADAATEAKHLAEVESSLTVLPKTRAGLDSITELCTQVNRWGQRVRPVRPPVVLH